MLKRGANHATMPPKMGADGWRSPWYWPAKRHVVVKALGKMALLALLLMSSACASTTLIESQPAGATLIIDGDRYAGETPVQVKDLPWFFSRRSYHLSMEGYHPRVIELDATSNSKHWVACVCTVGMMFPLVFFGRYPSDVVVRLSPIEAPARAAFAPQPSVSFAP